MKEFIDAVDLFAGAGGTSSGLVLASKEISKKVSLIAINHNLQALATHQLNFPWAYHVLTEIQNVNPMELVPEGRLDILVASPSCTFFSRARGGKPIRPQDRVSPWYVGKWISALDVPRVMIENVPEIVNWGPLYPNGHPKAGKPIKSRKGEYFKYWTRMFQKLGYEIDYRILNAADYGDPTTRKRFFAIARNDDKPIVWPKPTHNPMGSSGLQKWRAAKEVINWSIPGESIFSRKKPLSVNTMKRIFVGLKKFSSPELQPFIVSLEHSLLDPGHGVKDINNPLPTVTTAKGGAFALVNPFILPVEGIYRGNTAKDPNDPLGTLTQRGYGHLVEPFLMTIDRPKTNRSKPRSLDEPIPTIVAGNSRIALIDPFVLSQASGGAPRDATEPMPTIVTGGKHSLIRSFLVENKGQSTVADISSPLPTVTTVPYHGLIESFLLEYYGNSNVARVDSPMPTVTTKERFALIQPEIMVDGKVYTLEVTYRMLKREELAGAMGFPDTYRFVGNQTDVTWQIGNAVAVHMAKSLLQTLLSDQPSGLSGWGTAS